VFHFTIDVDWVPGSEVGLLRLFEICDSFGITPTLFVTGRFALEYPEVVQEGMRRNVSIGAHGWQHGLDADEDFRGMPRDQQRQLLEMATDALERTCGKRPTSFRAPNLSVGETTFEILGQLGYSCDSSIPAHRFDFFVGSVNRPRDLLAPLRPYYLHLKGSNGHYHILEVPPSAMVLPLNFRLVRELGPRAGLKLCSLISLMAPMLNFYIHPAELVEPKKLSFDSREANWYLGVGPHNIPLLVKFLEGIVSSGYVSAPLSVWETPRMTGPPSAA
jgi:peptidoglycan/xylan/chitin deacetylase (PgdA/CDA1 family)